MEASCKGGCCEEQVMMRVAIMLEERFGPGSIAEGLLGLGEKALKR